MSEELLQRDLIDNPEKIGKWEFRNIGATTLNALKNAGIIPKKDYKNFEKRKPDGIITDKKQVVAIVENKNIPTFKTAKQRAVAYKQGLEVAQVLKAKILILTDTITTIWINALNGQEIIDEKGHAIKEVFNPKNPDLEKLVQQILDSIDDNNSQIREPRLKDPTRLAKSVWQDLWMAAGATPENCLYTFVELFIFKYLSDLNVLKTHVNYDFIMAMFENESEDEVLEYYAKTVRPHIKKLFPAGSKDNTTIINGTIFVSKDQIAVAGYGTTFHTILKKFGNEKDGGGEFKNIDKDFKSKLFETFLKESISKKNWGQYFTPLKVVRAIVKMAESEIKEGITICDPACGVGKFLLEPLLINNNIEHFYNVKNGQLDKRLNLIGIDKGFDKEEQKTIILAKANMLIYMSDMIRKNSDLTTQFAEVFNDTFELKTKNILGTLRDVDHEGTIDLILTNPPYVTTGSSNLKDEIIKSNLSSHYPINAMGVEGLFMEWIIRALKPGGKGFIILPENLLFRQSDNVLRKYIIDECYIDGVISLPKKTFFTTIQKTFILCITKKMRCTDSQTTPVFTYIVSEIGESRDINRFDIDQDDLTNAAESFNSFMGSNDFFAKNNKDKRCKTIPFNWFRDNTDSSWVIDNMWTNDEKVELGIVDGNKNVSVIDYKLLIEDAIANISALKEELETLKELPNDICYVTKPIHEVFNFKSGNSKLTQAYLNSHKGDFVVYSSNTKNKGIFGYIDTFDYDEECIQITTNGVYAGTVFYRDKHKFSINGDARLLIKKDESSNYRYLAHELKIAFEAHNFNWENKPTVSKTQNIVLRIPVDKYGNVSMEIQEELSNRYNKIQYIKNAIEHELEKLNKPNIYFEG